MNTLRGFTLLELLVVLTILVIAVSLSAPSYREFVQRERHAKTVNSLQSLYKYARSEAVKRERIISIEESDSQLNVILPSEDNKVLRSYALPLSNTGIVLSGFKALNINSRGSVSEQSSWGVTDAQGVAPSRCIQVLLSGQLIINDGGCVKSG